jgi:hypothetical protein
VLRRHAVRGWLVSHGGADAQEEEAALAIMLGALDMGASPMAAESSPKLGILALGGDGDTAATSAAASAKEHATMPVHLTKGPEPEPEPGLEPESEPEQESAAEPEVGAVLGVDAAPDPEPDPGPEPGPEPGPDPGPEPEPEPEPDPEPEQEPEPEPEAEQGAEMLAATGVAIDDSDESSSSDEDIGAPPGQVQPVAVVAESAGTEATEAERVITAATQAQAARLGRLLQQPSEKQSSSMPEPEPIEPLPEPEPEPIEPLPEPEPEPEPELIEPEPEPAPSPTMATEVGDDACALPNGSLHPPQATSGSATLRLVPASQPVRPEVVAAMDAASLRMRAALASHGQDHAARVSYPSTDRNTRAHSTY